MTIISDSNAYKDDKQVLPQHQAALTLLQAMLADPKVHSLRWLDLACGRGQIISSLDKNLSEKARSKIHYNGYDIRHDYAKETAKTATTLRFSSFEVKVGDLSNFSKLFDSETSFDFITFTNTVHEVAPQHLAEILCDCVLRLSDGGCLFVYDMETLTKPELGAIPWIKEEVSLIMGCLCRELGATDYQPEVGQWGHRSCDAWSVQIQRSHLDLKSEVLKSMREMVISKTAESIHSLLDQKLMHCRHALESLTLYGSETDEERKEIQRLLYDFWSLSRALEVSK